jgi:two-component system sensor histidine kinase/response regulator
MFGKKQAMKLINEDIKVLIVEDNYLVSEMIKGSLEDIGYQVIGEAIDGLEAIQLTRELNPDVILMDIEMPEKNGIEATHAIYGCCPTPVVVLTAYEDPELVKRATEAGVGAYLIKPPNPNELERAITIAIARFEDSKNLRRLNLMLKARNQELDTFAHTVTHNFQHSLDLIIGYANILKKQARLPEEFDYYLNMIIRSGHTMVGVIDELELLAGIRRTQVEISYLNSSRIVARAQQRLAYMIADTNANLTISTIWPNAYGHAPWIEEVWVNLISTAITYGGQPPRLHLGATARSGGDVRFWVRNNGQGLTPEQRGQLFSVRGGEQSRGKGQWLGLSVVKQIIEKLGGDIGIESEGVEGEGNTFFFTLPAPRED